MENQRAPDYAGWLRHLILFGLAICALGSAAWALGQDDRGYLLANDLGMEVRHRGIAVVGATTVLAVATWLLAWHRLRRQGGGLLEALRRVNGWLTPAFALPLVLALSVRKIETEHPDLTLTFVLLAGIPVLVSVYRAGGVAWVQGFLVRTQRWLPIALVAVGALAYAYGVSSLALLDHRNLHTQTFDLGIYDNTVWNTAHGKFLGCSYVRTGRHTSAHVDPLLAAIVPFYWLNPRAETLLVFQSVWLSLGVIPLYRLVLRRLGSGWFGAALCGVYLLSPALHGVNMFDFHSLTMAVPLILAVMDAVDEKSRRYWLFLGLLILAREDMTLLSCGVGLYLLVCGRVRDGLITMGVALVYLVSVKLFVMPEASLLMKGGRESYSYTYFYEDMIPHAKEGARGLLISFLTNPAFALKMILLEEKVRFFLILMLPLLFAPFFSGRRVVTLVYGLAFIGLASRKHVFSLHFQYSSVLFPFLIAATAHGVGRVSEYRMWETVGLDGRRLRAALVATILGMTALVSWKYGVIVENDSFRAGWTRLTRNPGEDVVERYRRVRQMVDAIPPDAAVSTSTSIGPHVSNRAKAYRWPVVKDADYLIIRTNELKKKRKNKAKYDRLLKSGQYEVIDSHGAIKLLRRVE